MYLTLKELINQVMKISKQKLTQAGIKKRREGIFTCELSQEAIGWVGLNRATYRGVRELEINPVIGVRNQLIEKFLAELNEEKFHSYLPPTISTPLGYLMPENTYITWSFTQTTDNELVVEKMVTAITEYGVPFMKANYTIETLCQKNG